MNKKRFIGNLGLSICSIIILISCLFLPFAKVFYNECANLDTPDPNFIFQYQGTLLGYMRSINGHNIFNVLIGTSEYASA